MDDWGQTKRTLVKQESERDQDRSSAQMRPKCSLTQPSGRIYQTLRTSFWRGSVGAVNFQQEEDHGAPGEGGGRWHSAPCDPAMAFAEYDHKSLRLDESYTQVKAFIDNDRHPVYGVYCFTL